MVKKQKKGCPFEISNINGEASTILIERNEIMKLTKVAKSWEFTCSFCFKKFPSAQAMGGHQNAHRSERLEEKRIFVRDPICYRKRAYIRAMKSKNSSTIEVGPNPRLNLHAASKMVKNETANFNVVRGPPKIILPKPAPMIVSGGFGVFTAAVNGNNDHFYSGKNSSVENVKNVVMNLFPSKELSLDAGSAKYGFGGCKSVDLTLRL